MTSPEMFQLFQVLLDKLDTQNLPDIPVEQFFLLINLATDEYVQAIRTQFEENRKIGEDASTLVRRVYIKPQVVGDRVAFSFDQAYLVDPTGLTSLPPYTPIYYLMNSQFRSTWVKNGVTKKGITRAIYYQQDDITVDDPFANSKYPDLVSYVLEYHALIVTSIPANTTLDLLVGTAIIAPNKISQTVNSNLPEQIHQTLVKRSVSLALENIESIRSKTFDKV